MGRNDWRKSTKDIINDQYKQPAVVTEIPTIKDANLSIEKIG